MKDENVDGLKMQQNLTPRLYKDRLGTPINGEEFADIVANLVMKKEEVSNSQIINAS